MGVMGPKVAKSSVTKNLCNLAAVQLSEEMLKTPQCHGKVRKGREGGGGGKRCQGPKTKEGGKGTSLLSSSSPERTKATALRRLSSNLFYVVNPPPPLRRRRGCFYPLSSQGERSAWRKDGMRDAGGGEGGGWNYSWVLKLCFMNNTPEVVKTVCARLVHWVLQVS